MQYLVKQIPNKLAQETIIEKHYLHRQAPCIFAYGMFDGDELVGVCMFGTPASHTLMLGVAGPELAHEVVELTRLWVDDRIERNGESYLISHSLRLLPRKLVVSFADPSVGHIGYVYQASNWIYTGLSAKRRDYKVEGGKHSRTTGMSVAKMIEVYGSKPEMVDRPRKHRYIYVNAKGRERQRLIASLKYKQQGYPKK